jgi:O-antigen ligase
VIRVVVLAAFVIAVVGIYQKASMAEAMLWATRENSGSAFFAAFRYHANAASFLNLSWPAALAVYLRSRWTRGGGIVTSLDLSVFFFVFAAVLVNSSKAGQVLGLVGAVFAAWRFRSELFQANISRASAVILGVVFVLAIAVLVLPGFVLSHSKWSELASTGGSLEGRLLAYEVCIRALPESGIFGTGAGTFRHVFPYYTSYLEDEIEGFWYHAHQDWLQGLIEWGYAGFIGWGILFGGAVRRLWNRSRKAIRENREEITSSIALLALAVVLLHSLVDFPLQIPAIQSLVVVYLAIAWSDSRKGRHTGRSHADPAA